VSFNVSSRRRRRFQSPPIIILIRHSLRNGFEQHSDDQLQPGLAAPDPVLSGSERLELDFAWLEESERLVGWLVERDDFLVSKIDLKRVARRW